MEVESWSYFEAMSIVKELGYLWGVKLWWRVDQCVGKYEFKSITCDSHALEMDNYAIEHNCEVNLVVEHDGGFDQKVVKRAEVLNGVTREDKGKTVKVEDEVVDPNEGMGFGSVSGERINGLKDVCVDDTEEERNLRNDDGFGDIEIPIPHNEGTSHNEGSLQMREIHRQRELK
ncbi:hypothetical protein SESBI_47294 [Sesbania bispinosa]|nr:hypothetical protein SESBI_47294 [Sesbania bispinosa]